MSLVPNFNALFSNKSKAMMVIKGKFVFVDAMKQYGRLELEVELDGQCHVVWIRKSN